MNNPNSLQPAQIERCTILWYAYVWARFEKEKEMTGGIKSLPQCLLQSFRESPVGLVDFAFQLFTLSLLPEWIYQQYECHDHEAFISHLAGLKTIGIVDAALSPRS